MKKADVVWPSSEALKDAIPGLLSAPSSYVKDYELLFAVRLAAQCTDERVNKVTPALFARFPTLESLAEADPAEVERVHPFHRLLPGQGPGHRAVRPDAAAGLRRQGARHHGGAAEAARRGPQDGQPHSGRRVPAPPAWWWRTPTASASPAGWGSPTAPRTPPRWSSSSGKILPPEESNDFCHRMVLHGRAVCTARTAKCGECVLAPWCKYAKAEFKKVKKA